jgi:hypothetical protein
MEGKYKTIAPVATTEPEQHKSLDTATMAQN